MNNLNSIIEAKSVYLDVFAACPREVFAVAATKMAEQFNLPKHDICAALQEREKLGSTAIGNAVAIPHAKLDIPEMTGAFVRLVKPVQMDAHDDLPVDMFFFLFAPTEDNASHLRTLSQLARVLREDDFRDALRGAKEPEAITSILRKSTQLTKAA